MSWDPSDAHAPTWLPLYGPPPALHDSPPPAPIHAGRLRWSHVAAAPPAALATACSLGRLLGPVGPGSLVAFAALAANPAGSFDADAVTAQGDELFGGALLIEGLVAVVLAQIRDREL